MLRSGEGRLNVKFYWEMQCFCHETIIIVFRVKKRDVQIKTTESGLQRRLYLC